MDRTTLFLCGDLMLDRGVDQIFPRSVDPGLHEPHVRDARRYLELARGAAGSPAEGDARRLTPGGRGSGAPRRPSPRYGP